jgi:hypothetical protein
MYEQYLFGAIVSQKVLVQSSTDSSFTDDHDSTVGSVQKNSLLSSADAVHLELYGSISQATKNGVLRSNERRAIISNQSVFHANPFHNDQKVTLKRVKTSGTINRAWFFSHLSVSRSAKVSNLETATRK